MPEPLFPYIIADKRANIISSADSSSSLQQTLPQEDFALVSQRRQGRVTLLEIREVVRSTSTRRHGAATMHGAAYILSDSSMR